MAATTPILKADMQSCLADREELVWERKYDEMLQEQRDFITKGPVLAAEFLDFVERTQPIISRMTAVAEAKMVVLCIQTEAN